MADTDLIFSRPPLTDQPIDLVFGETDTPVIPAVTLDGAGVVTGLRLRVNVAVAVGLAGGGTVTGLRIRVASRFDINVQRPFVAQVVERFQDGDDFQIDTTATWQQGSAAPVDATQHFQRGTPLRSDTTGAWQEGESVRREQDAHFQRAMRLALDELSAEFQDAERLRTSRGALFQEGLDFRADTTPRFQEGLRDRRNFTAARYQEAVPHSVGISESGARGLPFFLYLDSRYQEAMRPPAGIWVRPGPEPEEPCYLPVVPAHLVFSQGPGTPHLVFVCERHGPGPDPGTVVVPIQRVYMVLNEATLRRVSDNALIPTLSMNMSLDVDSWTWSFSASLPWQALALVDGSEPTEVQAVVNGAPYRFLVEKIGTERTFGRNAVRITGRGKTALLDSPYAPSMFFGNTTARSAQQLMGDVLTINGVPLDWTVNWEITDWNVPGNVWTHQGSYMSALTNIATAPGAYIQPHPTAQELFVLPRYPAMPHQWADLTPDFDIPSAVMTREGIERNELPVYDRVFVSGTTAGVLGQVTRAGTSGELVAPMVTDALITHVDAARQRGQAVLSAVGRQQNVSLRMPVLEETGIIPPGKLVLYRDGGVERLGFTRSVQVDVGLPEIWQTLGVETYA